MSQVNLLPPELRQREAVRRRTGLIAAAGVLVLVLIGAFYYFQTVNLSHAKDDLAAQESINSGLQTQIAGLQQYAALQSQLGAEKALIATLFSNEISWSNVLIDVSRIIPADSYLTSLTGTISATTSGVPTGVPTTGTTLVGNVSFAGVAKQTDTLASWLTRLEQVKGWVNPWASSMTENGPFSRIYTFSNGIDLTTDALTPRGRGVTGSLP